MVFQVLGSQRSTDLPPGLSWVLWGQGHPQSSVQSSMQLTEGPAGLLRSLVGRGSHAKASGREPARSCSCVCWWDLGRIFSPLSLAPVHPLIRTVPGIWCCVTFYLFCYFRWCDFQDSKFTRYKSKNISP